jgi:hypothetical protein
VWFAWLNELMVLNLDGSPEVAVFLPLEREHSLALLV